MNANSIPSPAANMRNQIAEVKYSLAAMLEELKAEREASVFAMEQLGQSDIEKLFKARGPRGNGA